MMTKIRFADGSIYYLDEEGKVVRKEKNKVVRICNKCGEKFYADMKEKLCYKCNPVILQEKSVVQNKESKNYGEVTWKPVNGGAYFNDIDKLFERYYKYRILTSNVKSWSKLINLLDEIKNEIATIREEIEYA